MEIRKLSKFYCQKVLPLVYDDSLSYYEFLCKLFEKLNEVIGTVNQIQDVSEELAALTGVVSSNKKELDEKIAAINYKIASLENLSNRVTTAEKEISRLKEIVKELQTLNSDLKNYIDSQIENVKADYNGKFRNIENVYSNLFGEILAKIADLYEKLDQAAINVFNYSANKRLALDDNNTKLYIDLENAISAEEYCSLGLSAEEYKKFEVSALDYLRDSKKLLKYGYVYMPVSGKKQNISVALTEIINEIKGTITADTYSSYGLTADGYAGLSLDNNAYRVYKK